MDRFERYLNTKSRCEVIVGGIALVMKTDNFIYTARLELIFPDIVDYSRYTLADRRVLGKMQPHDIAEYIAPHNARNPCEKSAAQAVL